jgi:hypothetical protein
MNDQETASQLDQSIKTFIYVQYISGERPASLCTPKSPNPLSKLPLPPNLSDKKLGEFQSSSGRGGEKAPCPCRKSNPKPVTLLTELS